MISDQPTTEEDIGEGFEPSQYFRDLKNKINSTSHEQLDKNRTFLEHELRKAHDLGQKNLAHKAAYMWSVLEREMALHAVGIDKFVYRQDLVKFIDKVTPKDSVKIVELAKFPRTIPDENVAAIKDAQKLGLFDEFIVVYTDFVDEEVSTPAQKAFIARNKDPIVFGMFKNDNLNLISDRLYFITDWEDEFCDLTFTKLIEKMSNAGIKSPEHTISPTGAHITKLVNDQLEDLNKEAKKHSYQLPAKIVPKSRLRAIWDAITGKK